MHKPKSSMIRLDSISTWFQHTKIFDSIDKRICVFEPAVAYELQFQQVCYGVRWGLLGRSHLVFVDPDFIPPTHPTEHRDNMRWWFLLQDQWRPNVNEQASRPGFWIRKFKLYCSRATAQYVNNYYIWYFLNWLSLLTNKGQTWRNPGPTR